MENTPVTEPEKSHWYTIRKIVYVIGSLILFLFALDLMISALQHLGNAAVETIILATSNPFTGLFIGLLITAMVQSSSTTTAMAVALVASRAITLDSAIPIIMGANIGTTITSTIVSLGFINKKKEFRRAVSAGTYHDFFNILTVAILFPLQYYYGFLTKLAEFITRQFYTSGTVPSETRVVHTWSGFDPLINFLLSIISSGFVLVVFSFALLFVSIILFRKLISSLLLVNSPEKFSRFFFKNQFKSFLWGLFTTAAIRSSTVTTSVVVPIVAKKIVTLRKAVPFILGANIGTTVTAFIAAILNSNSSSAIHLALIHLLLNIIGFLIFYPIPFLRRIPYRLALYIGKLTLKYRLAGLVYILLMFFFIPFSLIYLNRGATEILDVHYKRTDFQTNQEEFYHVISKMNKATQSGEWLTYYKEEVQTAEPDLIFPVYLKNNILFINSEMYMFNKPGFCWDGESRRGKYQSCIKEILPSITLANQTYDSVYVYARKFYDHGPDSVSLRYYISAHYHLILKRETLARDNRVILSEEIIRLESK